MHKILRNSILFSLIVLVSCNNNKVKVSSSNNDSIEKYLKLASNNTLPFPERDKYNQKAFSLIDLSRNDSVVRWYLSKVTFNYISTRNHINYKRISGIHLMNALEEKDTLNLARSYRYRAAYYKNINIYDSAFYFYLKAEKYYKKTNDKYGLAKVYLNKGVVQNKIDDYLGAELSNRKAYKIFKNSNFYRDIYTLLINSGNLYVSLKQYGKAITSYEEAMNLIKKGKVSPLNKESLTGTCLNNIGNVYREMKNYEKANLYFKEAQREQGLLKNDPSLYAILLNNIGFCYININKYDDRLPKYFEKSAIIFDSLGIKNECAVSNIYLSDYYFRIKDTLKAISYSEKALQLAKDAKAPYYYLTALSNAGFVNKNKAPQYIKEYHEKNDSLQFEERKARNQFFKIQLETDQITQEKETAIKQKWVITSIISSVLLIVILLFIIHRQRAKQKELQLLQTQQKANEEIYQLMLNQQAKVEEARQIEKKRIALELHDGIMNRLASTRLNLFVLSKKNDPETINNCLTYIEDIHDIENEIRNVSHDLNQELFLEKDSFKMLLKQFVKEQNSHNTTHYELQIDENVNWELVSSQTKMHLYRIIQEASHNTNKYAKATQASICFIMEENQLCLSIFDNGIGFDAAKTKEGIGLQNIQQRSQAINSVFSIESNNKGTRLDCKVPI